VLATGRQVLATTSRGEITPHLGGVVAWGLKGGVEGSGPVRI
jgi:hypothetical protein